MKYVHAGYESRYERYVILDVDSGRLVRTTIISDTELQRQQAGVSLGKLARLLKRFPPLWAAYSAMGSRQDRTHEVAADKVLDD